MHAHVDARHGFPAPYALVEPLTEELMRAEREAYGKLIRTISHEVNNTMAGLLPLFDLLAAAGTDPDLAESLRSCAERCDALGTFIAGYASVARLPEPDLRPCSLNALIESMIPFLESMATGRHIAVVATPTEADTTVDVDAVMLEQVIVNVVKNSIESIGQDGRIVLATAADEGHVTLTITDNGPGISPQACGSLFAPFFSTKAGGRGIGLTLVAEVLRRHRCSFSLSTDPDSLTRFTIHFPR